MDLLEKFEAVSVVADHRISVSDKEFCEMQQCAYEAALSSFKELSFFWADMKRLQEEILQPDQDSDATRYLLSPEGPTISSERIQGHIEFLHREFITIIFRYFNQTYDIDIPSLGAIAKLVPQPPERSWHRDTEQWDAYHTEINELTVKYQDIVDHLLVKLDGRSFSEQAFHELAQKCHNAAWNSYQKKPEFERKKDVLRFNSGCHYRDRYHEDRWELTEGAKEILRGIAHYETGSFHSCPTTFSDLLGYSGSVDNEHEFPACTKVQRLKMFKSQRLDIKFSTEAYAEEFASRYLGLVC